MMIDWILYACFSISAVFLASTVTWRLRKQLQSRPTPSLELANGATAAVPLSFTAAVSVQKGKTHRQATRARTAPQPPLTAISPKKPRRRRRASSKKKPADKLTHDYIEIDYREHYEAVAYPVLSPEVEVGNNEYKLKLDPPREDRFQQLVTQMKFRLDEGHGVAFYQIGVQDNGAPDGIPPAQFVQSLKTLSRMALKLGAALQITKVGDGTLPSALAGEVMVRKLAQASDIGKEIRVAICGDGEAGKSTLLGVLSSGQLDNGRGQARMNIFRHKHELENGRTSVVGREILGFDAAGRVVNYPSIQTPTWSEIIESSAKVISFMDLAGHKRYFKTTMSGMIGNFPAYAMLLVDAKTGVVGMTQDHYQLSLALKVPCVIVLTKLDICPPETLAATLAALEEMLRAPGSRKEPLVISNETAAIEAAARLSEHAVCPIFEVSNVTGLHLDLLRLFLSRLDPLKDWVAEREKGALMYIDDTFSVPEVGTVVSGTLLQGMIGLGDSLMLGPTAEDAFVAATVTSIHASRLPVQVAKAGQSICVAIDGVDRAACRKGQALAAASVVQGPVWEFDADVCLVGQAEVALGKREVVVHCGCSQQTAVLERTDDEAGLQTGRTARVHLRFKYHSEFLITGDRFLIREGSSVGVGTAVALITGTGDSSLPIRSPLQQPITV